MRRQLNSAPLDKSGPLSWPQYPYKINKMLDFQSLSKFDSCLNPNCYDCLGVAILNSTAINLSFITRVFIKMKISTFRQAFAVQKLNTANQNDLNEIKAAPKKTQ